MANISDGTYIILNASNTALAVDSCGATSKNGANVALHENGLTGNGGNLDGQLICIWTRDDGTRQLMFACTGKCLDVTGYDIAQGANIAQYSDNDSRAQQWLIVDGSRTVAVGSTSYDAFKIYLNSTYTSSTKFLMEVEGVGTPAEGANICLAADETVSDDQFWIFVPQNPVKAGTYALRSRMDTALVADVNGISTANGANVFLNGYNDGNNQKWWVREYVAHGRAKIYATHSMKLMELYGTGAPFSGQNVCQAEDDGGADQMWVIEPHGSGTLNGCTVPSYRLHNYGASGVDLVLDACGAVDKAGANIMVFDTNGGLNQRWIFDPAEMLAAALPTASTIRLGSSANTFMSDSNLAANNVAKWYPSWLCEGTEYQVRYRIRTRQIDRELGDWGCWKCLADGSQANDGWGRIGYSNCTTPDGERKYSPIAIDPPNIDNTSFDYGEVQVQVRRFSADYLGDYGLNAHGNPVSQVFGLAWKPTLTVTSAVWSNHGLSIGYSCDYRRGGNTVKVGDIYVGGKKICSGKTFTGQPHVGSVTVPITSLSFVPADKEACSVNMSIDTDHASSDEVHASLTVAYASGNSSALEPIRAETDRLTYTVEVPISDDMHCYILSNGKFTESNDYADANGTRVYELIPSFGVEVSLLVCVGEGSNWITYSDVLPALPMDVYAWNFGNDAAFVKSAIDDRPSMSDKLDADYESNTTTGREYPVFRFGESRTLDLSVSGSWIEDMAYSNRAAFERLQKAHHAIFRNPAGERYQVAVTSVSTPLQSREYGEISVTQYAESL